MGIVTSFPLIKKLAQETKMSEDFIRTMLQNFRKFNTSNGISSADFERVLVSEGFKKSTSQCNFSYYG